MDAQFLTKSQQKCLFLNFCRVSLLLMKMHANGAMTNGNGTDWSSLEPKHDLVLSFNEHF
jgi:hypothetical protein